jgi:hypothetical protein
LISLDLNFSPSPERDHYLPSPLLLLISLTPIPPNPTPNDGLCLSIMLLLTHKLVRCSNTCISDTYRTLLLTRFHACARVRTTSQVQTIYLAVSSSPDQVTPRSPPARPASLATLLSSCVALPLFSCSPDPCFAFNESAPRARMSAGPESVKCSNHCQSVSHPSQVRYQQS